MSLASDSAIQQPLRATPSLKKRNLLCVQHLFRHTPASARGARRKAANLLAPDWHPSLSLTYAQLCNYRPGSRHRALVKLATKWRISTCTALASKLLPARLSFARCCSSGGTFDHLFQAAPQLRLLFCCCCVHARVAATLLGSTERRSKICCRYASQ